MSNDVEKKELTLVPNKSRISLALNVLITLLGVFSLALSPIWLFSEWPWPSQNILSFTYNTLIALALAIFAGRNVYRFLLVPYYTITLKPDSIEYENFKTGATEKVIKADDIECVTYRDLVVMPKKRTLTHWTDRISVRDYSNGRISLLFQFDLAYYDIINDFKINRIAFDKERMGITISPEISKFFTLGGNLLIAMFGIWIVILGINVGLEDGRYLLKPLFSLLFILSGLIITALAAYLIFRYFFVPNQMIILKNDSIIFENLDTGEVEKTITPSDIEQLNNPRSLVLLLKNGHKEIISVKDFTKSRFLVIPDYKAQHKLSNRILTFIAENYEHVFVPNFLLTNEPSRP